MKSQLCYLVANQRGCGSYHAGGAPGLGRGCSAGRSRGPLLRWCTPAAAAAGTTVVGVGGLEKTTPAAHSHLIF